MSWLPLLALLLPALADPAPPAEHLEAAPGATVLAGQGLALVLELAGEAAWASGDTVALFVAEQRADPRTGELVAGQRYAGDATVLWVGGGPSPLVELVVHPAAGLQPGDRVRLAEARNLPPIAAWRPPAPPPPPAAQATPASPAIAAASPRERRRAQPGLLGSVHQDRRLPPGQALALSGGWSGDGYGTGLGSGGLTWRLRPARGPARVELSLLGLRGQRWVEAEASTQDAGTDLAEDDSREPTVGYWLWSRVDSAGIGLAVFGGLGGGVEAEGLALGAWLGLRTGHPDGSHLAVDYQRWGRMGQRWTLQGLVAFAPALSTGVRVRRGNLPGHDGDFAQDRADGALLLDLDPTPRLGLTLGVGLGGYDLLIADAGLVADGALELRW